MRDDKNHRIRVRVLTTALTLLYAFTVFGQSVANYGGTNVSRTTGITYNSIVSSGNAIPAWRNGSSGNANTDDNRSYPVPIGFDFWYDGKRCTQFNVSTNGFVDFDTASWNGGPGTGGGQFNPFGPYSQDLVDPTRSQPSGGAGTTTAIAPFYYDLATQGMTNPLGNSIKYLVTGVAPNRVLTVEWISMASFTNPAIILNFQVRLHETTGVVDLIYGSMAGTIPTGWGFGYSIGMNAPSISPNPPTTSQLLALQTENTATFNNGQQFNLITMMQSNSQYTFTPPTPANPTSLTFSGVTQTQETLSWIDNATNESGYAIYFSTDGANYTFLAQQPANAISYTATNLAAGTTYYWQVYAVTEGHISNALQGNQTTSGAFSDTTATSGNWSNPATWRSGIPGSSSNVVIADGHTVTLDVNATANSIQVGYGSSGVLKIGSSASAVALTVLSNLSVNSGGQLIANTASLTTNHSIAIGGNTLNNGTIDLAPTMTSRVNAVFNRSGSQTISGNGALTRFNTMVLNMGASSNNVLDIFSTNFTDTTKNFLVINNGTFRVSTGTTISPFSGPAQIPLNGGLWLNNGTAIVSVTDSLQVQGLLRVTNGTLNIGTAADENLISKGGTFIFEGGATNIAGRFAPIDPFALSNFTLSGGTLTVPTIGSTSRVDAPFKLDVPGSTFNMTGGTLVIRRHGGTTADYLGYINTSTSSSSILGGTIQLGDGSTPAADTIRVRTDIPVYNLNIASSSATARLDTSVTVKNSFTITSGSFVANNFNLNIGGDWTDFGSFVPGSGTVTLIGNGSQNFSRVGSTENLNNLVVNNAGNTVTLGSNLVVAGSFNLLSGTFLVDGTNTLTLNGSVTGVGNLTSAGNGTVFYNQGSAGQNVLPGTYVNLSFNNSAKTLSSIGTLNISGVFSPGSGSGHVVTGSTVNFNGTGTQSVPAFTYNNLSINSGGAATATGAITIQGGLTIGLSRTINDNGNIITVNGNLANSGTHVTTSAGGIVFSGGSSVHLITGGATYGSLTLNDLNGASIVGSILLKGTLNLQSGVLSTNTDTLSIDSSGTVLRTSGYVNGALRQYVKTGNNNYVFPIGDATKFSPDTVRFYNVRSAGFVTSVALPGKHPQVNSLTIDPTNGVNRYWQIRNNHVVFDSAWVTTNYVDPADVDQTGFETSYIAGNWNGSIWTYPTMANRSAGTAQARSVTTLGDLQLGAGTANNAYQTIASGNWNNTSIWQSYNGTSWVAASSAPDSSKGSITVSAGNTVTVTSSVGIDQTIVQSGATLIVQGGNTLRVADGPGTDLTVSGTLIDSGSVKLAGPTVGAQFAAGSNFNYAHDGTATDSIPRALWDPNSTCLISGIVTTAPPGLNQTFGNFTWNSTNQTATINLASQPTTIGGNYTVSSTGSGQLNWYGTGDGLTKNISGNLVVQGGNLIVKTGTSTPAVVNVAGSFQVSGASTILRLTNNSQPLTLSVNGNTTLTSGTVDLGSSTGIGILLLKGNLTLSGGILTVTGSAAGDSISFNGTSTQSYIAGSTISNAVNFLVGGGSTLSLSPTDSITGGGNFTLANGGTLVIGHKNGINGAIQSATRSLGTAGNFIFNGIVAQSTGSALPASINRLTINNVSGVSLSGSTILADSLKLLNGQFNVSTNSITLNGVAYATSGSLTSAQTGTVIYNQSAAGQGILLGNYGNLTFNNSPKVLPMGTLFVAGVFNGGSASGHGITANTINLNGAGAQTIPSFLFNNLSLSGSGTKTLTAVDTVLNSLSIGVGTTLADGGNTLLVKANIANSGIHSGTGNITLSGSSSNRSISGGGLFSNVILNDVNGISLTGNITINGQFTLTSGIISSSTDTVILNSTVNRPLSGGYINAKVKKPIALTGTSQQYTFETGDASSYAPVAVIVFNVTTAGSLTASTIGANHPSLGTSGIDVTKDAQRYWTIGNQGVGLTKYSATFNFVSSDLTSGANPAVFSVKRFAASVWNTTFTSNRTSTSISDTSLTAFGDFAAGQLPNTWTGAIGSHNWGDPGNWSSNTVPTSSDVIAISIVDSINVNVAAVAQRLTVNNSNLRIAVPSSGTLTLTDSLNLLQGTLYVQSAFPSAVSYIVAGGTVNFNGLGAQTVPALQYNNLTISNSRGGNNVTMAAGTIGIAALFNASATNVAYITTSNTVAYNGTVAQTIVPLRYNNLTISGSRGANNVTFGTIDTIRVAGTLTASASFSTGNYVLTGSTLEYNGSGAQTITALPYNTLRIAGSSPATLGGISTLTGDLTVVSGTLDVGTTNTLNRTSAGGTFTLASSASLLVGASNFPANFATNTMLGSVNYYGSGAQTVVAVQYSNLSISGSRGNNSVTFGSGTVGVSGALTLSASFSIGGYVTTGNTMTFNGTGAQTIPALPYNNLTISNARGGSTVTLSSGTIGIAGVFTPSAIAVVYTTTSDTISFNGSGSQNIPAFTYNNLIVGSNGGGTATGALTVRGSFAIPSGKTFNDNANTITLNSSLSNSGTHASTGAGALALSGGSIIHSITGGGTYGNITLNDANGASLIGSILVKGTLQFTLGDINTNTDTLSIDATGAITGASKATGYVNGALRRYIATGNNSYAYPIGDSLSFTPDTIRFFNVATAGFVTSTDTADKHPQSGTLTVDPTNGVNRYWRIRNNGVAFDSAWVTLAYVQGVPVDLDQTGFDKYFKSGIWNGASWTYPTMGWRDSSVALALGFAQSRSVTSFGDFQLGAPPAANTTFRSHQSGNWSLTTTWETWNGTSWVTPAAATPTNLNASSVLIQSTHTVAVSASVTVDQVEVAVGGTMVVNAGITLTVNNGAGNDLVVDGMVQNAGTVTVNAGAVVKFNSGSTYKHTRNGGVVPAATWDPASTCLITGVTTTLPTGLGQAFGNFTWNSAGQTAAIALAGNPTTINGDFTVVGTNTGSLVLYGAQTTTKNILGNFVIQGGTTTIKNNTGAAVINVKGALNITGGTLTFTSSGQITINDSAGFSMNAGTMTMTSGASNSNGILNVLGYYSQTAGTISESSTGTGRGSIIFAKSGTQNFTSGGTVSNLIDFTVNSGSDLELGTNLLTGGGNFTLSAGGTLGIGSTAGVTSSGATGNVQVTGSRTFNTTANYIINGSAAQITGNGLPANVNRLTVNNAAGVSITASTTLADSLKLLSGAFNVGANTLTLNSTVYATSGILTSASNGTVIYNQASSGQVVLPVSYGNLTFSNFSKVLPASVVSVAGTFIPGTGSGHTITGNTINLNSVGAQSVPAFRYSNLTLSSSGSTKTLVATDTVLNTLTIGSGVTLADGGNSLLVNGNISNAGTHSGTGSITMADGSTSHVVSGGGAFGNVALNDINGATFAGSKTSISGTLSLTQGSLSIPTNSDTLSVTGSVNRGSGYVVGNFQRSIPTGASSVIYDIGTQTTYRAVRIAFNNVTTPGLVTIIRVSGEHPNILDATSDVDSLQDVNVYWRLANNGTVFTGSYSAVFSFINSSEFDAGVDPTSASFGGQYWTGSSWVQPPIGMQSTDSTRLDGVTAFGDFVLGMNTRARLFTSVAPGGNWNSPSTWTPQGVPGPKDSVVIVNNSTVTMIANQSVVNLTVNGGGILNTNASQLNTSGNITLNGTWIGAGPINWTATNGTLKGTGTQTGSAALQIGGNDSVSSTANLSIKRIVILSGDTLRNYGTVTVDTARGVGSTSAWVNMTNSTLNVTASLLPTSGVFVNGGIPNTVNYDGTGAQTVSALNYSNLVISGARSSNTVTLAQGTIGVAGIFTPSATSVTYVTTGDTLNVNGSGGQSLPSFPYSTLNITSGGTVTLNGNITLSGDLIVANGTLDMGVFTLNSISGTGKVIVMPSGILITGGSTGGIGSSNFPSNYATYTINGTVEFNSSGAQTIPSLNYTNLILTNVGTKTIGSSLAASGDVTIDVSAQLVIQGGATFTVGGNFDNSGLVDNHGNIMLQ